MATKTQDTPAQFALRAYKQVGYYGKPVYAILRNSDIIGELLFDGGRPKNAGGPAWVATLFQTNGCHVNYYGKRGDYAPALELLKSDRFHLATAAENRTEFALKRSLTYKDGELLNEPKSDAAKKSLIPEARTVKVRLYPGTPLESVETIEFDARGNFEIFHDPYTLRVLEDYAEVTEPGAFLQPLVGSGTRQDGVWHLSPRVDRNAVFKFEDIYTAAVALVYDIYKNTPVGAGT